MYLHLVAQDPKKLRVYQKAVVLSDRIDVICDRFSRQNGRLADQLSGSAATIPATIAEGCGRATAKDFAHFLTVAISSANETEDHLRRALARRYISEAEHSSLT